MEQLLHSQIPAPSQWGLSPSPPSPWESRSLAPRLPPSSTLLFFHLRRRVDPVLVARYGRWDSNAGNRGSGGFGYGPRGDGDGDGDGVGFGRWVRRKEKRRKKRWWRSYDSSTKRRWWSDDGGDEDEDEGEEPVGIWEEVMDSFWILKVFKSYGWTLPIILLSWLAATGPKAFLITLALPFIQSALALVIKKLWPGKKNKSKGKARRRRRKRYPYRTDNIRTKEERDWRWNGKDKIEYDLWEAEGEFSAPEYTGETNGFGGWDELEGKQFTGKSSPVSDRPRRPQMDIGKYSRKASRDDVPLLLRLLVAMFPFLGSWTKMFW